MADMGTFHSSGSDPMNEARAGGLDRSRHTEVSSINAYVDMAGGGIWQVVVLTVAVVVVAWRIFAQSKRPKKRLPNGPRPWPIVGNFPSLAGDLPHRALRNLAAKYGGLMFLRLGSRPCIVVSTVEVAREVFQNHDAAFLNRPPALANEIMTGYKDIVFSPHGPHWRHLRRICNTELFSSKSIAMLQQARTEEIHNMMRVLRDQSLKGDATNLKKWLYAIMCNNVTRMVVNKRDVEVYDVEVLPRGYRAAATKSIFKRAMKFYGTDAGDDQQETEKFITMITGFLEVFGIFLISDFIPYLRFVTKLQGRDKWMREAKKVAFGICTNMMQLEERRNLREARGDEFKDQDFLDMLMSDKDTLSDEILKQVVVDLLVAGTETCSTTIEWAMTELMRHPDAMREVQAEVESVVGKERLVQESDTPNLPRLRAFVKEVFRMHPPVAMSIPRESTREVELSGFTIPAGTRLMVNLFAIHRDPGVYESPDEFRPERFFEQPEVLATAAFDHYQLEPYGAGRRMCPGTGIGSVMVHTVLAHMLQNFDWSLPAGDSHRDPRDLDINELFVGVLNRKTPLELLATPKCLATLY